MANLLKPKIGISVFSISILILVPLLESNFNTPITIKRWSKLTWDDFQGFVQPFTKYEAAIASAVYLEYDSIQKRFYAYAGQNNVRSWAKRSRPNQEYELNHEQYHFNITELHARKLNEYIAENPDGSEYLFNLRRGSINIDLRKMQNRYDSETKHSLIYDRQSLWEFKVDSLLILDSGWVTDKFSGARIYFPGQPEFIKGITKNGYRYREFAVSKYGMYFSVISFQNELLDQEVFEKITNSYKHGKDTLKSLTFDSKELTKGVFVILRDSATKSSYIRWVYDQKYLYNIMVTYPNNTGDTTGYSRIANSFINSFSVVNTDSLWIADFEKSPSPITYSRASKMEGTRTKDSPYCLSIEKDEKPGLYRRPILRDDGALLLPFDYLIDPDSLHYSDVLLIDNEIYSFGPTKGGQVYFIPADKVPKSSYQIDFGYTLKKDSLKECYQFYHHTLQITPQIQPTFAENGL